MFTLHSWILLFLFFFSSTLVTTQDERGTQELRRSVRRRPQWIWIIDPPTFRACRAGTMRRRTGREDERSGIRPADVDSRGSAAPLGRLSLLIASYSVQPAHSANLTRAFFTSVASALTPSRSLHSKPINPPPIPPPLVTGLCRRAQINTNTCSRSVCYTVITYKCRSRHIT